MRNTAVSPDQLQIHTLQEAERLRNALDVHTLQGAERLRETMQADRTWTVGSVIAAGALATAVVMAGRLMQHMHVSVPYCLYVYAYCRSRATPLNRSSDQCVPRSVAGSQAYSLPPAASAAMQLGR